MAKANITTKDGATISIEGTADEVAVLLAKFRSPAPGGHVERALADDNKKAKPKAKAKVGGKARTTATTLLTEMIGSDGFKKPRFADDVRKEWEQGAHFFDRMTVNTALRRAVKKRELRRIKQGKKWAYVA